MLKPAKQPHIRLTALFLCVTMFLSTLFFNAHTASLKAKRTVRRAYGTSS